MSVAGYVGSSNGAITTNANGFYFIAQGDTSYSKAGRTYCAALGGYGESSNSFTSSLWKTSGNYYNLAGAVIGSITATTIYTITVQYGTGGTASGSGQVASGGSKSITATPTDGGASAPSYTFSQWNDGVGSASRTLTNVTADATYTATFAQSTWKITANSESATKGTVSSAINQYRVPGTTVSCTATPKLGYTFIGWFRAGQSLPDYTTATASLLVYSADTVYTAKFYDSRNSLTVSAGTGGSVTIKKADGTSVGSGSDVDEGVSLTVTATPEYNYAFNKWTGSGISDSTSASYSFAMPATPVTLVASFTQAAPLTLTVSAENETMGAVDLKRGEMAVVADPNKPVAGTASSPASISGSTITVTYSGSADVGTSGLKKVELWASKDGGAWGNTGLTDTGASGSFIYTPSGNGSYAFRLVAEDNAGNRSAAATGSGDSVTAFTAIVATNLVLASNGGSVVSCDSQDASYPASNLIDGSTGTEWRTETGDTTAAIVFKFSDAFGGGTVTGCVIRNPSANKIENYKIYFSQAASGDDSWVPVAEKRMSSIALSVSFGWSENNTGIKRVKLEITSGYGSLLAISEIEFTGRMESTANHCSIGAPDSSTTYGDDVSFGIKFTRSVTGFTIDDITLNKTGTADGTLTGFDGENGEYTVSVTDITGAGTIGISVAADVCQDADEVLNNASNSAFYTVSDEAVSLASLFSQTIYVGIEYTLTAVVTDTFFHKFVGWYSGAGVLLTDQFAYTFTPATDDDIAVVAKFAENPSYVVTKRSSDGSFTYSATNEAAEAGCDFTIRAADFESPDKWLGGNLSCTAVPATGWQLAQWTVAQGIPPASLTPRHQNPPSGVGTPSNPYVFDLAFDAVVHAIFTKIPYTVTVTADPAAVDAGAVTDCFVYDDTFTEQEEITVLHGDDCEIWATAADGFSFAGWYLEDGTCVSTDRPYAPVVTSDLTLIAKFKATVSLTAAYSVNADEEGTVQIDGGTAGATATKAVIIGETCTITAIGVEPVGEAEGAIFNSWHLSTDTLFEEPIAGYLQEQEITVDGNLTLNAYFVGDADLETRYLALRNYNNNTSADDPLIGILESSGGEEIEALEYFTFIYGGAPPAPAMPGAGEPGPRYFKFTGTQSTTLGASSVAGLGFMRWERVHLVAVDLPGEGDPHWTLSTPAVVVGTSPTPTILTSRHFVMTAVWGDPQPVLLTVKYASGSDSSMGSFNADPETEAKQTVQGGFSDVHLQDSEVLLTANVLNGYLFSGWYYDSAGTLLVSADTAYTHKIGSPVTIYAKFIQDTDAIYRWEGDTAKKMLRWRSKRYVAVRPFNPSAARVYADAYPVTLNLYMASSPDAPVSATVEVQVKRQDGLRLPMARPEKYMEVEVTATGDVTEVAVGTSMGGLAQ